MVFCTDRPESELATGNGELVAHARLSPFTYVGVLSIAEQMCYGQLKLKWQTWEPVLGFSFHDY